MRSRSLLHPNHARKVTPTAQQTGFQAPDIFVVPPEEDEIPPWCCYNAQQGINNEDDHDQFAARYHSAHKHTSYFHTSAPGLEDFMPSNSKGHSETRSIVDALGDADDDSENESDHEPGDVDLEDEDGVEFGLYGRSHQGSPLQRVYSTEPPSPRKEVGNDSDIIEVVKVRRRGPDLGSIDNDFFGPSENGYSNELNAKSSFRSRASKAFRSLRGTIRSSSKMTSKYTDSVGSHTKPKLSSKPHTTLQFKPRAQDIFSRPENMPPPRKPDTPDLDSQPSGSRSQLHLPALKRRPSSPFYIASRSKSNATSDYAQGANLVHPISPPATHDSHILPTPPQSSSNPTSNGSTYQEVDDVPTPTRTTYQTQSGDSSSTPSHHASIAQEVDHHKHTRSMSPTPPARSVTPGPSIRQASKSFSVRNLHKIFYKSSPSTFASDAPHSQVPSTNSASSICPSLSSSSTGEWSEPATPSADSLASAPTSVDEGEVERINMSTPGASTSSSIHTISGNGYPGRTSEELNRSETPIPDFDLSPEFTLNLELGLDINTNPTNGAYSSKGKSKSKLRPAASLSRSLSLKKIGSRLRLGKQAPPVPPLPVPGTLENADMDMEMRLDSFHFDDLSFDTDRFVSR